MKLLSLAAKAIKRPVEQVEDDDELASLNESSSDESNDVLPNISEQASASSTKRTFKDKTNIQIEKTSQVLVGNALTNYLESRSKVVFSESKSSKRIKREYAESVSDADVLQRMKAEKEEEKKKKEEKENNKMQRQLAQQLKLEQKKREEEEKAHQKFCKLNEQEEEIIRKKQTILSKHNQTTVQSNTELNSTTSKAVERAQHRVTKLNEQEEEIKRKKQELLLKYATLSQINKASAASVSQALTQNEVKHKFESVVDSSGDNELSQIFVSKKSSCYICQEKHTNMSKYTWHKCQLCDNWICDTCLTSRLPNFKFTCTECY